MFLTCSALFFGDFISVVFFKFKLDILRYYILLFRLFIMAIHFFFAKNR